MEHSALHAAQLLGVLLVLAAPLLALLVLLPARRTTALTSASGRVSDELLRRTARAAAAGEQPQVPALLARLHLPA